MISSSGKISGHSRTSFKHKKVFSNYSRNSKVKSFTGGIVLEKIEGTISYDFFRPIKVLAVLISIPTLILLAFLFNKWIDSISTPIVAAEPIEHLDFYDGKNITLLQNLYDRALIDYNNSRYMSSHEKLYAILLVDEKNMEAENLLLKVLERKCKDLNWGCTDFKNYAETLSLKHNKS